MKTIVVSPSNLDVMDLCLRLYQFSAIRRLTMLTKEKKLDRGSLIHIMAAHHYREIGLNLNRYPVKKLEDIVEESIALGTVEAASSDLDMKSIQETMNVYRSYVSFWEKDEWVPMLDDKGEPLVEVPFSKMIYQSSDAEMDKGEGIQIILIGKIDMILAPHGQVTEPSVIDHKTYDRYWDFNPLSNQMKSYAYGTGLRHVGRNTFGFQKEGNENKFKRNLYTYTKSQLDEWARWAVYKIISTDMNNEMGAYPPNYTSCDKFGGCRFKKVCVEPPEFREAVINARFVEGKAVDAYSKPDSRKMNLRSETTVELELVGEED